MYIEIRYPEHIYDIKEIRAALDAGDAVGLVFEDACDGLEDDLNITTARVSGIAHRERILGITPLDTESLEDRRLRVMLRWYSREMYTLRRLKEKLDASLGKDAYELTIDYKKRVLRCLVEITRRSMVKSMTDLLEEILPLDLIFYIDLRRGTSQQVYVGAGHHMAYKPAAITDSYTVTEEAIQTAPARAGGIIRSIHRSVVKEG